MKYQENGEDKFVVFRFPTYFEKHQWLCALKKAGTPGAWCTTIINVYVIDLVDLYMSWWSAPLITCEHHFTEMHFQPRWQVYGSHNCLHCWILSHRTVRNAVQITIADLGDTQCHCLCRQQAVVRRQRVRPWRYVCIVDIITKGFDTDGFDMSGFDKEAFNRN